LAVDLQVVFPQETIRLTSVRVAAGTTPILLDVVGEDFSSIDVVEINEIEAPAFFILSRTRMLVQMPDGLATTQIRNVTIISRKFVLTEKSLLRFRVGRVPSKVSGTMRLVQLFLKVLLTTAGTDIFNRKMGGSATKNLSRTFSGKASTAITSDFVVSVQNTVRQITAMQSRTAGLPASEKLLNAKVLKAQFSPLEAALLVTIEVSSQTGRAAIANLVV